MGRSISSPWNQQDDNSQNKRHNKGFDIDFSGLLAKVLFKRFVIHRFVAAIHIARTTRGENHSRLFASLKETQA